MSDEVSIEPEGRAAGPGADATAGGSNGGDPPFWPVAKRVGFRFLASYFLLYTFPFPLGSVPLIGRYPALAVNWLWRSSAPWVGAHVLGIEGEMFLGQTGSGDTTFDYVRLFMMLVLAALATVIWSLLDRRRPSYERAARWLVVGTRYYLGLTMLGYGIAKVIPTQFMLPPLQRLLQPYGESSPMGIVWTFMGVSPAYTIFAGAGETIGGLLLFFRRTRTLGAAILIAVVTNVVMLNYAYDVPVKLFSSHLLLMAIGLVALDARRLLAVFWSNEPVPPADRRPLFDASWANRLGRAFGLFIVAMAIWGNVTGNLRTYRSFGNGRPKPETWGIHDVERFVYDGEELPPLLTDNVRWRALIVDRALPMDFGLGERPGQIIVWQMNGRFSYYQVELDEAKATFTVIPRGQASLAAARQAGVEVTDVLHYERPEPGVLVMRGTWLGKPVEVQMRDHDLDTMLLINRGYHWINELPYNR